MAGWGAGAAAQGRSGREEIAHTAEIGRDMTASARGYTVSKDQLRARLRRIEGQVRGIERMVVEERYCIDVLTQISAVQAALDKVALGLLDDHARHCLHQAANDGQAEQMTDEMMAAVGRLMKRG
jgi:DNA-binding FrmR family transcriptional regulator